MKKFTILLIMAIFTLPAIADTWVNGYQRSNGTYVQGHYRSSPNSVKFDNYSSKGNVNPYTGERGSSRHEFSSPSIYDSSNGGYGSSLYGNGLYGK